MNICALAGRIATEPNMRYTSSGTPVVQFRLAVNRPPRPNEQERGTDFLTIVAFGRQAELIGQFLDKGALVGIVGRISSRQWETPDGQRRERVEIIARHVEFLETRAEAERRRAQGEEVVPEEEPPPPDELELPPDEEIFGDI